MRPAARLAWALLPLGIGAVAVLVPSVEIDGVARSALDRPPAAGTLLAPALLPLLALSPVPRGRLPRGLGLVLAAVLLGGVGILGHFQLTFSFLPTRPLPGLALVIAAELGGLVTAGVLERRPGLRA